ncbi:MAG TPA: hypothetical protein VHZ02_01080 [Acidimicrobiales bacterium]|nr:hypothetical protein [Acidimicrobiales bacterium]
MKFKFSKKAAIIGLSGGVALGLSGMALAYWTTGGAGTGSPVAGSPASIVVNQTATLPANLYPGAALPLAGTFTNTTNPGAVYITSVTATITAFSVQTNSSLPACTQADFSISGVSNTPGDIAHGTAVGSWNGLVLNMTDATTNQDNCEGVTVPIVYTAS